MYQCSGSGWEGGNGAAHGVEGFLRHVRDNMCKEALGEIGGSAAIERLRTNV
jgi:hypothetical protein